MKNLQKQVEQMINSENKRRAIAIQWLDAVSDIMVDVAPPLWGNSIDTHDDDYGVEEISSGVYFRYEPHYGDNCQEDAGFFIYTSYFAVWGQNVKEVRGQAFWNALRDIIRWIEALPKDMDDKTAAREAIIDKLRIEGN